MFHREQYTQARQARGRPGGPTHITPIQPREGNSPGLACMFVWLRPERGAVLAQPMLFSLSL